MHPIVEKEREISEYLEEWIGARYEEWHYIYQAVNRDRHTDIYRLKSGTELLQLFCDIIENIANYLLVGSNTHVIPSKFSSIPQLLQFLENFKRHINNRHHLIENNFNGEDTNMIVVDMYKICQDIDQMVTRCLGIYMSDDSIPIPYQRAKSALSNNNVKLFVELMGSLIKNVPYNIHKEKLDEGYFHTIIHVITAVLGMNPVSEAETSNGRIDMMIEYPNRIFIMEFKYSKDGKDRSKGALKQIKDNNYAEAYYIKGKVIEGIGLSFSQKTRNIDHFKQEELYKPHISIYQKTTNTK